MNTHQNQFMLVMAEFPRLGEDNHQMIETFEKFSTITRGIEDQVKGARRIGENIWLIPLSGGMLLISKLIQAGQEAGVPVYNLILDHESQLIKSTKDVLKKKT